MKTPLVSIIIPTKNSSLFLEECLESIRNQTYTNIEILIIDGDSKDKTIDISKKYTDLIYQFNPNVTKGTFDAPHRRNYGIKKSNGEYVYYVDADMKLTEDVIKEALIACQSKYDAIIIPEDSFGVGIWANAKNLERRCYWGDNSVEAPRFFNKIVWEKIGGLDENLGGGGDDWDLHQKLIENNYRVGRINSLVMHNEGNLQLERLFRKRFLYGRDTLKYIAKRPKTGTLTYFPIRKAYLRNWRLFLNRPFDSMVFIVMRSTEYFAGFSGILYSFLYLKISKNEKKYLEK